MHRVPVHMYFISVCMCVPACVGSFEKGISTEEKNGHWGNFSRAIYRRRKKKAIGSISVPMSAPGAILSVCCCNLLKVTKYTGPFVSVVIFISCV